MTVTGDMAVHMGAEKRLPGSPHPMMLVGGGKANCKKADSGVRRPSRLFPLTWRWGQGLVRTRFDLHGTKVLD